MDVSVGSVYSGNGVLVYDRGSMEGESYECIGWQKRKKAKSKKTVQCVSH